MHGNHSRSWKNMVIEHSERGTGYGATLLNHIERFSRQADCTKIMLFSNRKRETPHAFFPGKGFSGHSRRGFVKYRSQFDRIGPDSCAIG